MLRFLVVALAVSAAWAKPSRIFEDELTMELQSLLQSFDPVTVTSISDTHIVTDHSDLTFSATDVVISGFSKVEVTDLEIPIPGVSHLTKLAVHIPQLDVHTDAYSLHGTHDGAAVDGSGTGYLTFHGASGSISLETDSVSLSPLSVCVKAGTLAFTLENASIEGHLDGLDEINAHISEEMAHVIAAVVDKLNAESETIESTINILLCS